MVLLTCHFQRPEAGGQGSLKSHTQPQGVAGRCPLWSPTWGGLFSFALPSPSLSPSCRFPLSFFFDTDFLPFLSLSCSFISLQRPSAPRGSYSFLGGVSITEQSCDPAGYSVCLDLSFFICKGGIRMCISQACDQDSIVSCSVVPRETGICRVEGGQC